MRITTLAVAVTLSLLAGRQAVAAEQNDAALNQAVEAHNANVADTGDQLVCRKEATTGSRIKKTVCRTQKSIAADHEAAERYLNKPRPVQYKDQ